MATMLTVLGSSRESWVWLWRVVQMMGSLRSGRLRYDTQRVISGFRPDGRLVLLILSLYL